MTTAINLPLYRVLKALNVSDADAEAAAQAGSPDLSRLATKEDLTRFATKEDLTRFATKEDLNRFATKEDLARFATKDELRAEIAGVKAEIAQGLQRQTTWFVGALVAALGVLFAVQRLMPQPLPSDAVRAIVAQTVRDMQAQPGAAVPPRAAPQP